MPKRKKPEFPYVLDYFHMIPDHASWDRVKQGRKALRQRKLLTRALIGGVVRGLEITKDPSGGLRAMLTMDTGVMKDVSDEDIDSVMFLTSAVIADRLTPPKRSSPGEQG